MAFAPSSAAAETYQNDGFSGDGELGFQAGFAVGEGAASCFEIDVPVRLTAIQLVYGGDRDGATIFNRMGVWDGSNGPGTAPGEPLHIEDDVELVSSTQDLNEYDLTSFGITVEERFCVGVIFTNNGGLPSIPRDNDGTIDAANNWLFAQDPIEGRNVWRQSAAFGLTGDWVIRAIGTPQGGGGGDTGIQPDAGTGGDAGAGDAGGDAGGGDAGTGGVANPEIFDVDQEGNVPTEDITVIIEGQNLRSAYRYSVDGEALVDVQVNGDGTEAEGVWQSDDIAAPGEYDLEIRGEFPAQRVTERDAVTVIEPPLGEPTVTALSPDSAFIGEDEAVIISGANFQSPMTVTLCGRPLVPVTIISETQAQVVVPGDLVGTAEVCDLFLQTDAGSTLARGAYAFNLMSGGGGGCAHAPARPAFGGLALLLGLAFLRRRRGV